MATAVPARTTIGLGENWKFLIEMEVPAVPAAPVTPVAAVPSDVTLSVMSTVTSATTGTTRASTIVGTRPSRSVAISEWGRDR